MTQGNSGHSDVGGYHGEGEAFHAYTKGIDPLAERLRGLADKDLGPQVGFSDNAFSKIGQETGLSDAIRQATQRQHDRVQRLAGTMGGTSEAVRNTWTNLESIEQDATDGLRRATGELA
ncbi:MAG: hypothetical protein M3548_18285 [Actinomycetota bacterium]|nr:hypothetical protein [Actinomycetota bacterium]